MRNSDPSDPELLADWLHHRRERAFHALVVRYAGLVQATARRTCGDESMAAEISQLTFITLARKAKSLTSCTSLGGWLHRTSLMHAKNLIRQKRRENRKRQHLAMEPEPSPQAGDPWQEMQPVLDDALAALSDKDREAILLRFYRSLSVREVAATLGIATHAAQKRIDRATERLRGKLTSRGCQAGGSLGAVMLAGFAADAQTATLSVSAITSKAMAAGAVRSGIAQATIALFATTMKSTSLIISLTVLTAAMVWIGFENRSIAKLNKESMAMKGQLDEQDSHSKTAMTESSGLMDPNGKIAWRRISAQMAEAQRSDELVFTQLWARLTLQASTMNAAELVAAMDEIRGPGMPPGQSAPLESVLLNQLRRLDPMLAVTAYFEKAHEPAVVPGSPFSEAFRDWAKSKPEQAAAWLDQQIAAGKFDTPSPANGKSIRIGLEDVLLGSLMAHDSAAATQRMAALSEGDRVEALKLISQSIQPKDQLAYAELVRTLVPVKKQADMIARPVAKLVSEHGLAEATEYMARVQVTPLEREECVKQSLWKEFIRRAEQREISRADFVEIRNWVDAQDPKLTARMTGEFLALIPRYAGNAAGRLSIAQAAEMAVEFQKESGDDEVLAVFLEQSPDKNMELLEKVADPVRRQDILDQWK